MLNKETKEKEQRIKNIRFEEANLIMRRLFYNSVSDTVGYSLFRDVLYKSLESGNTMSTDEKIQWACQKFIFDISYEEALEEIYELVMRRSNKSDTMENRREALETTISEAMYLHKKSDAYKLSTDGVKSLEANVADEFYLVKVFYEISMGSSARDAIEIVAKKVSDSIQDFDKKKEEILKSINKHFSNLDELEKFISEN